ncbi:hypothetical protein M3Y97_00655000 [Aphelenchoides bicaudatus]|nr:hypothetical protein M3Y97_00655000 [Aphelenchoides bicaudatus]
MSECNENSAMAGPVVDDWENIAGDEVQQLTNERLNLVEQQQRASVMEQQIMKEQLSADVGLQPGANVKPIKLLKREQPLRKLAGDSEGKDEAAQLGSLTIDERKANYDKIRERIFAEASLDKEETKSIPDDPKKSPKKETMTPTELNASTSNEVVIETINHLSNVQMLSEQTPQRLRYAPPQPPLWVPPRPQELRSIPPLQFMPPAGIQPPPIYGMPPPQSMCFMPPADFSRPPPSTLPYSKNQVRQNFKP